MYAPDGTPQRFAADFEQRCVNVLDTSPTYGELRFNSTIPFSALLLVSATPNLSTRGPVATGDGVLIGGFIIDGTTSKNKNGLKREQARIALLVVPSMMKPPMSTPSPVATGPRVERFGVADTGGRRALKGMVELKRSSP